MTALYIIGGILLFFIFIGSIKAKITIAYSDDLCLSVRVLFLNIKILPKKEKGAGPHSMSASKARKIRAKIAKKEAKKKEAKRAKALKKAEKKKQKEEQKKAGHAEKPKKSMSEILDMVGLITELVGIVIKRFFKHLRIDLARLKVKVATPDAATTAIAYGAMTQALNILLPLLESVKTLKLPGDVTDIDVAPDFTAESPEVDIKISFSLRVWHLFDIIFKAAGKFIKHIFKKFFK